MHGGHAAEAKAALQAVAPRDIDAHFRASWHRRRRRRPPAPRGSRRWPAVFAGAGAAAGRACRPPGRRAGRRRAAAGAGGRRRGRRWRAGAAWSWSWSWWSWAWWWSGARWSWSWGRWSWASSARAARRKRERADAQVLDALAQRLAQAGVDASRAARRSPVRFSGSRLSVVAQLPLPASASWCDGFEVALQRAGVGDGDQLGAGAAAGDEQRGGEAEQGERRADARSDAWRDGMRHLIDRTPAARRASPAGARRGSPRPRRRCRSRRGGRRRPCRRGRAAATTARGSPSRGCPTLPGFSSHSPSATSSCVPSRRGSPVASSPSWRTNESATWEWPIRQMRCGWASRHSSASSAESTYSHTGSRGLAW